MPKLYRRHTAEIAPARNPGLRLLPAMLVGAGIAAAFGYFAIGLRPAHEVAAPELDIHVDGEDLVLPDGSRCHVARHGCDTALARVPPGSLVRVISPPDALFALAAPALATAAREHREALLDIGAGPVHVLPFNPADMKGWSDLNPDAPGLRLRVIIRADGIWIGSAAGKVLGSDPHGPSLLPLSKGQDFEGLARKLRTVKVNIQDTEDSCGLLPALDTRVGDVVRAADAIHGSFTQVLLAVP